jgi:hypothetical protein
MECRTKFRFAAPPLTSTRHANFFLRLRFEIGGVVPLVQLSRGIAGDAIDHPPTSYRWTLEKHVGPTLDVLIILDAKELGRAVKPALRQSTVPRENRNVGDRVSAAGDILILDQAPVEHVELTLHFHGEAVNRISYPFGRVGVEMPKAAAEIRRASHLPEQLDRHSARAAASLGRKAPNFSARYIKIAPDSNTRIGFGPLRSTSTGILEFGFTATKPLPNCSPSPILISHASYSAPRCPSANSSSCIIVTFWPFGVASEYSCNGWRPTGKSLPDFAIPQP